MSKNAKYKQFKFKLFGNFNVLINNKNDQIKKVNMDICTLAPSNLGMILCATNTSILI